MCGEEGTRWVGKAILLLKCAKGVEPIKRFDAFCV